MSNSLSNIQLNNNRIIVNQHSVNESEKIPSLECHIKNIRNEKNLKTESFAIIDCKLSTPRTVLVSPGNEILYTQNENDIRRFGMYFENLPKKMGPDIIEYKDQWLVKWEVPDCQPQYLVVNNINCNKDIHESYNSLNNTKLGNIDNNNNNSYDKPVGYNRVSNSGVQIKYRYNPYQNRSYQVRKYDSTKFKKFDGVPSELKDKKFEQYKKAIEQYNILQLWIKEKRSTESFPIDEFSLAYYGYTGNSVRVKENIPLDRLIGYRTKLFDKLVKDERKYEEKFESFDRQL